MTSTHRARKRFGQNFLHDQGVISRILRAVAAMPEDHVLEIGPGQGALTAYLADSGCRLDIIELDRDLAAPLQARYADKPRVRVHQGDALNFDFATLVEDQPLRVVGNLPYNISTPLIFHLLAAQQHIRDMHFMLQREVVERLAAGPGSKTYGRLGIMTQYYCRVDALFEVPPEAFSPRPKVQSAVVKLTPHQQPPHRADDVGVLETVLRSAFNQRRKTLRNALKEHIGGPALENLGIDPGARPETLDLAAFVAIANYRAGRR